MKTKIYYEPQTNWGENEYYYLHRVLHRIFYYYGKNRDEISSMDFSRMSERTKTLIYCIIKYYHREFLFDEFENVASLRSTKPLAEPLVLVDSPLPEDSVYRRMNVVY